MRTNIDKSGRVVVPKVLRDEVGLVAGEVVVYSDGASVRIEPPPGVDLDERDGRLVVPESGIALDDDVVLRLRDLDRR